MSPLNVSPFFLAALATLTTLTTLVTSTLSPAWADSGAQTFSYQGQLMDDSGQNPLTGMITFKIGIYADNGSPDGCLLYEEQQQYDVTQTEGYFSLEVGSIVGDIKRTANSPALSMPLVFANKGVLLVSASATCLGGYTPSPRDSRRVRLTLTSTNLGSPPGTPVILSPDQVISAAPQSLVAETIQGLGPEAFAQISGSVTQTNLSTLTNGADALGLHHHDSRYMLLGASGYSLGSGNTFSNGNLGIGTSTPNARLEIVNDTAGKKGAVIKGFSGQAENLFELRRFDGTLLSSFDANGGLHLAEPTVADQAATKNYVDTYVNAHAGITFNGRSGPSITLINTDISTTLGLTLSELSYLSGVTGAIQTQFGNIQTQISSLNSSKEPLLGSSTVDQFLAGDKVFRSLNTGIVTESGAGPYYFTNTRAQAAINVSGGLLSYTAGTIGLTLANLPLAGSGPITYGVFGNTGYFGLNLASGQILVGNASNQPAGVTVTGDGTLSPAGVFTLNTTGTSGTFSRVSVNSKGIVTSGAALAVNDLVPALVGDLVGSATGNTVVKIMGNAVNNTGPEAPTGITGVSGIGTHFMGWNGNGTTGHWEPLAARGTMNCSQGTRVGKAGDWGSFCITNTMADTNWANAVINCKNIGAHLCSAQEWITACAYNIIPPSGNAQWVMQLTAIDAGIGSSINTGALTLTPQGGGSCMTSAQGPVITGVSPSFTREYRCCLN